MTGLWNCHLERSGVGMNVLGTRGCNIITRRIEKTWIAGNHRSWYIIHYRYVSIGEATRSIPASYWWKAPWDLPVPVLAEANEWYHSARKNDWQLHLVGATAANNVSQDWYHLISHRIHVWYICEQWYIDGKCYHIYHTWILWVYIYIILYVVYIYIYYTLHSNE